MVILRLENCEKCTSLPSLGLLASLKDLIIEGMTRLKCIGSEIYGEDCSKPFRSLENLSFADLDEWEYWDPLTKTEKVERFPSLHKLSIVRCPKLTGNLPDHLPSLEELVIHECAQLLASFSNLPRLRKLELEGCRGMICTSPTSFELVSSLTLSNIREFSDWFKLAFQKLQCLQIVNCEELVYLWQEIHIKKQPTALLKELSNVRELCIENFPNLKSLPRVLEYSECLQSLRIGGCHSLQFIVKSQLPPFLKRLEVKNCDRLQYLVGDKEADYASH
ncbi:hypothetical protein JRO89_XS05G0253100 [Xanthoceras sorbifolium]|uniref:Uncharacterized protein n=1 Tax=Xanthoceras sorbifolium TaxID=99658 RepID=A0ABQ8I3B6_9ROSI|nr:hypothetical protein JRO89_XS05G0253100 [Xanthoceras sorbifolium]